MSINMVEESKKKSEPKLVKLDRSFKLAEQWVNNMSASSVNDKSAAVELEGRPARLGIGATVPREYKVTLSNDPVERKLLAKLNASKRKVVERDTDVGEESEEDESESKTKVFGKKRPALSWEFGATLLLLRLSFFQLEGSCRRLWYLIPLDDGIISDQSSSEEVNSMLKNVVRGRKKGDSCGSMANTLYPQEMVPHPRGRGSGSSSS